MSQDSLPALLLYWAALGVSHAAVPEEEALLSVLLAKMSFFLNFFKMSFLMTTVCVTSNSLMFCCICIHLSLGPSRVIF